ncbi:hypothetical protein TNCV_4629101 [Trichonephila clavipes]|nr:hypothetical protein TNCV_4629101 [Trichonephila clavipes]
MTIPAIDLLDFQTGNLVGRNHLSSIDPRRMKDSIGQGKQVCLQWIPSHVGVPGNETAVMIWLRQEFWPIYTAGVYALSDDLGALEAVICSSMTFLLCRGGKSYLSLLSPASPAHLLDCWSILATIVYEKEA